MKIIISPNEATSNWPAPTRYVVDEWLFVSLTCGDTGRNWTGNHLPGNLLNLLLSKRLPISLNMANTLRGMPIDESVSVKYASHHKTACLMLPRGRVPLGRVYTTSEADVCQINVCRNFKGSLMRPTECVKGPEQLLSLQKYRCRMLQYGQRCAK